MSPVLSFKKDFQNGKIVVRSKFNSDVKTVWNAFTDHTIADKWYAPKPYQVVIKEMDFKESGRWLNYMLSPAGEKFWSVEEYIRITPYKSYKAYDSFCDENGVINKDMPRVKWTNEFAEDEGWTTVTNMLSGEQEDIKKLIEMGFEEGYRMSLKQLNELLMEKRS